MKLRRIAFCLAATVVAIAPFAAARSNSFANKTRPQNVVPHAGWQTLTDCHYVMNASNDGDSFHVAAAGKPYLFRLYFVDTPETDVSLGERIDEQAKYFGINHEQTLKVGKLSSQFTREKLTQPFTVRTCFQDALGRSKMERSYAIIQTTTGDLGEQLIENGLARIHGASANPTGLPRANVEWQKLQELEREARSEKVGGWGVNFGRMLARSEKANNRAAVDPFDAFFHPNRVAETTESPQSEKPKDSFDAFFHTATPTPIPAATIARSTSTLAARPLGNKLDVNTASEGELENLPAIGPALAGRIIAARPFKSADDLRHVKGIGDVRYEKIRPYFN